jgi:hypothetical protein
MNSPYEIFTKEVNVIVSIRYCYYNGYPYYAIYFPINFHELVIPPR